LKIDLLSQDIVNLIRQFETIFQSDYDNELTQKVIEKSRKIIEESTVCLIYLDSGIKWIEERLKFDLDKDLENDLKIIRQHLQSSKGNLEDITNLISELSVQFIEFNEEDMSTSTLKEDTELAQNLVDMVIQLKEEIHKRSLISPIGNVLESIKGFIKK